MLSHQGKFCRKDHFTCMIGDFFMKCLFLRDNLNMLPFSQLQRCSCIVTQGFWRKSLTRSDRAKTIGPCGNKPEKN